MFQVRYICKSEHFFQKSRRSLCFIMLDLKRMGEYILCDQFDSPSRRQVRSDRLTNSVSTGLFHMDEKHDLTPS